MTWTWDPSCSPDVALYVLFALGMSLAGWTPCPIEDDPGRLCAVYERTSWIEIGQTPGLSLIDTLPAPAAGAAWWIDVEAVDQADQMSAGEGPPCD